MQKFRLDTRSRQSRGAYAHAHTHAHTHWLATSLKPRVRVLGETTRLGMATEATLSVESIVRGYHVYKNIWAASGKTQSCSSGLRVLMRLTFALKHSGRKFSSSRRIIRKFAPAENYPLYGSPNYLQRSIFLGCS